MQEKVKKISFVTWIGLISNAFLCIIKIGAGVMGNSRALIADGVHSISDIVTDIVILIGVQFWLRPPDLQHPYGHQRLESFVSLLIGIFLCFAGIGIAWDAAEDLLKGGSSTKVGSLAALGVAVICVLVKEILFRWTLKESKKLDSEALEANAWGHRADAVSSLPVIAAVAIAMWVPGFAFVDLVGALLVAGFIVYAAIRICIGAVNTLMDKGASKEIYRKIGELCIEVPGILGVHKLRTRYMGKSLVVDLHISVDGRLRVFQSDKIAHELEAKLKSKETEHRLGVAIGDVLAHVDPHKEDSSLPS